MTSTVARVTQSRLVHGEWIKLRSVRSTRTTLVTAFVVTIVFGVVFSMSANGDTTQTGPMTGVSDPLAVSLGSITLTQLIVGVVGVLIVAGEYSTGLLRTLFGAVGGRVGVLRAKAAVVGLTTFAMMAVAITIAVIAGQAVYSGSAETVTLADDGVWRVLLGATTYLAGIAMIGVALGFILRSTSGAIGVLVAAVFILPGLLGLLPESFSDSVVKYLPSKLGESMRALNPGDDLVAAGPAFLIFLAWVVGLLCVAAVLVRRRDA